MIWAALLLGLVGAVAGIIAIEKKRRKGPLTYPLWRGNLLLPWGALVLLCALLIGGIELPRYVKLVLRGVPLQATISGISEQEHCGVTYSYKVQGVDYVQSDSQCGLKAGDIHTVYYDPLSPDISTLYPPRSALKNELEAMALICLCLPTLIVLWLMSTWVIRGRGKP